MNRTCNIHYKGVYEYLKNGIINGEFDENYTFVETEIAERLNVSRTPVREAIKMLKSERILENIPQKGIHCRKLSGSDIEPVYEVAEALEGVVAFNVASMSMDLDFSELENSVNEMEFALAEENEEKWVKADIAFHKTLRRLCSNKFAVEMLDQIEFYIEVIRSRYTRTSYESKKRSTIQHREAYEAIISGDAEYAKSLVQHHWKSVRKQITKEMMET